MRKRYYVYILSNYKKTTLYIGLTSDLKRRVFEYSQGSIKGFTQKYKLKYLMHYEVFEGVIEAINREKSLKGKSREKKEILIKSTNPNWNGSFFNNFIVNVLSRIGPSLRSG